MQSCKACGVEHPLSEFEKYTVNGAIRHRQQCKKARQERRKEAVKKAPKVDPDTVPLCNYMKKDMRLQEFLGQISRIFKHTSMWVLGDTRNVLNAIRGPRKPVAALDESGSPMIIFPSGSTAATILNVWYGSIKSTAIDRGNRVCGVKWTFADVADYKRQELTPAQAAAILRTLRNLN